MTEHKSHDAENIRLIHEYSLSDEELARAECVKLHSRRTSPLLTADVALVLRQADDVPRSFGVGRKPWADYGGKERIRLAERQASP